MPITIAPATTDADRAAVIDVAHDANASTTLPLWYAVRRQASPIRKAATWWLLRDGGEPVASCLQYDLAFTTADGEHVGGYGFGSVATRRAHTRRGLASRLCGEVADRAVARGARVGLLFSAIPPRLYERLAYVVTPAWQLRCRTPAALAASGPKLDLRALDPWRDAEAVIALYHRHHAGTLHLRRSTETWAANLGRNERDGFVGWGDPLRGYARLHAEDGELDVIELICPDPADAAPALRAIAGIAASLRDDYTLVGWHPPVEELAAHFVDEGRAKTLPMVRGDVDLTGAQFWGADYF